MPHMNKEEVAHLATLARIKLSPEEEEALPAELNSIVAYVSAISDIAGDVGAAQTLSARHNIFRSDEVTNEPGAHTKDLIEEMPDTEGEYLKVRKILKTE